MEPDEASCARPVPAPRRLYPELRKSEYENVSIDAYNQQINIIAESLHNMNTTTTTTTTKNKTRLLVSATQKLNDMHAEELYAADVNENLPQHNKDEQQSESESVDCKRQATAAMAASSECLYAMPQPAPRPRGKSIEKQQQKQQQQQQAAATAANDKELNNSTFYINLLPPPSTPPSQQLPSRTASPSKSPQIVRRAPELPPKVSTPTSSDERRQRHSISSEFSTTSDSQLPVRFTAATAHASFGGGGGGCGVGGLSKSISSATLNSSSDGGDATTATNADQGRFKSPSPGDLLKSLGTTSKLLTESIGERVALKAKGAKNMLDKNLKTSTELISSLGTETTSRLKIASKRFGNNFTLGRRDKINTKDPAAAATAMPAGDCERPQTMPPNNQVFNAISFISPLSNKMAVGMTDLSMALADTDDGSYDEVPRKARNRLDLAAPPAYEDVLYNAPQGSFRSINSPTPAAAAASTSTMAKNIAIEAANRVQQQQQQQQQQQRQAGSKWDNYAATDLPSPSPPMPNFPPPALPQAATAGEDVYGKLNPPTKPVRHQRRKNYEEIQLRRAPRPNAAAASVDVDVAVDGANSMRGNVDSAELHKLNQAAALAEREESMLLREQIKKAEAQTPKPERSDSWEFYTEGDANEQDDADSASSSPEPVYANQDATYGKVFELPISASARSDSGAAILAPHTELVSISEEQADDSYLGSEGAAGGWLRPPQEIIQEFDPLSRKSSTLFRTDKTNELLLLEHLLEEETYGTVKRDQSKSDEDDISMCTSEEDNLNVNATAAATTATASTEKSQAVVVLPTPTPMSQTSNRQSSSSAKKLQIVHQNAQLLSDSMENMLDKQLDEEARAKPYLCRVDEPAHGSSSRNGAQVDLAPASMKRTNWFVDSEERKETNTVTRTPKPAVAIGKLNIEDGECPPSYLEAIGVDFSKPMPAHEQAKSSGTSTAARAARFINPKNVFSNVKTRVDALKRRTSLRTAQKQAAANEVKVALPMIPRPSLSPLLVRYEGPLIRFPSGVVEDILKEMQNRKAILRDRQFQTFLDQEMRTLKETLPLDSITTLQCVSDSRVTDNSTHFYCFEITTSVVKHSGSNGYGIATASSANGSVQLLCANANSIMTSGVSGNCKQQRVTHLYGVGKESERGVWMQKLLESLTNILPVKYACHYYRAGWCYLKNSITSEWSGTWLVLKKNQRRLIFVSECNGNVEKMDLRKARCIVLKDSDDSIGNLYVESGPMLMIDCPPFTVYMIMATPRETKIWRHIIREVAHNNGFSLSDQQLTKFNVPVIVDKCINFVYIHGSMSEGIYRKSGSENSITKLMAAFRSDAFSVEITRNEYNEHDVANVLKRFMRDLPERLIGKLTDSFISVTTLTRSNEKIPIYNELLARLSAIERETLKKIVGHLLFISSQKSKNKMSIQNLTMIWGPTLLAHSQAEEMIYSQKESDVLADLIMLYKHLFPFTEDELKKEEEMFRCLQKYYAAAETLSDTVKKSGDLKMWITLNPNPENDSEEKPQVSTIISPTKTAYEICRELAPKMRLATHQITLYEVILNGMLERPLHHDSKVFDVILNWSYWPEDDRKHNYLVVKPIDLLREVQRAIKNLATVTPGKELKFVDNRTKHFKTFQCELRDGKIVISKKDKSDKTTIVREIFLHSTTTYLGCEKKRDFPWSWALTFIESTKTQIMRSRDAPYIGHVLAGSEWVDRTIWYSSIWWCLYGDNILPPPEMIFD